jgi:hypothetical protein
MPSKFCRPVREGKVNIWQTSIKEVVNVTNVVSSFWIYNENS